MYVKIKLFALFSFLSLYGYSQKKWTLMECVQYAMENNISVKQSALQTDLAALTYKQSKLSQIPTLNLATAMD